MSQTRSRTFACLVLLLAFTLTTVATAERVPGDADNSGALSIGDAVYIINYIFGGGPPPLYQTCADVNDDCLISIGDAVTIINYIFGGNPVELTIGCPQRDINPGCSSYRSETETTAPPSGEFYAEVLGNDLHLHHIDAYYQCCLGYHVEYQLGGYNITAVESDTGALCDCYCYFNLESVLYDLEAGEYQVTLIGIEGEIVGTETVVVDSESGLIGYSVDGCLERESSTGAPEVEYLYSNKTVTMQHYDGFYNCGSEFMVDFAAEGDTLRFLELTVNTNCAFCMCYFHLTASVAGIEPGRYIAEIWGEDCESPLVLVDRRVVILAE